MDNKKLLILKILIDSNKELYGLDIIALSNNKLHRGTIYVHLQNLEEKELIISRIDDLHPLAKDPFSSYRLPRRLYKITEAGKKYLFEEKKEIK